MCELRLIKSITVTSYTHPQAHTDTTLARIYTSSRKAYIELVSRHARPFILVRKPTADGTLHRANRADIISHRASTTTVV